MGITFDDSVDQLRELLASHFPGCTIKFSVDVSEPSSGFAPWRVTSLAGDVYHGITSFTIEDREGRVIGLIQNMVCIKNPK